MKRPLAAIPSAIVAALLAATPATAKEPRGAPAPITAPAAEPVGARIPWPVPPPELARRYPEIGSPRILRRADGGLVLATPRNDGLAISPPGQTHAGMWLVELDASGTPAHQLWVPIDVDDWPHSALPMRDGGYLIYDEHSPGLLRIDRDGGRLWSFRLWGGATGNYDRIAVAEMPDGGLLIVGESPDDDLRPYLDRATRLDAGGRTLWEREYDPRRKGGGAFAIQPLGSGALFADGHAIYRIDAGGRPMSRGTIPFPFRAYPSPPDGLIVVGWEDTPRARHAGRATRYVMQRVEREGRVPWRHGAIEPDTDASTRAYHAFPAPDGGIIQYLWQRYDRGSKQDCRGRSGHALARFDPAGRVRWVRNLRADDDAPCHGGRWHEILDIGVLPDGRMLLLWSATGAYIPGGDASLWLTSMPFD
jgi:hypothetical protein